MAGGLEEVAKGIHSVILLNRASFIQWVKAMRINPPPLSQLCQHLSVSWVQCSQEHTRSFACVTVHLRLCCFVGAHLNLFRGKLWSGMTMEHVCCCLTGIAHFEFVFDYDHGCGQARPSLHGMLWLRYCCFIAVSTTVCRGCLLHD